MSKKVKKVAKKTGRVIRKHRKETMAVTIPPRLLEKLREVAAIEDCSVSVLVQRCIEEYLPVIQSVPTLENGYRLDAMLFRLFSAVTTMDMRTCGMRPVSFEFGLGGKVSVSLVQHKDASNKPIPIALEDVYGPPREEGETDEAHEARKERYYKARFHFGDNEKTEVQQDQSGMSVVVHHLPLTPVRMALAEAKRGGETAKQENSESDLSGGK